MSADEIKPICTELAPGCKDNPREGKVTDIHICQKNRGHDSPHACIFCSEQWSDTP